MTVWRRGSEDRTGALFRLSAARAAPPVALRRQSVRERVEPRRLLLGMRLRLFAQLAIVLWPILIIDDSI